ncbi:MAG: hypothetical protein ABR607_17515, partial [Pyrinomonadaceae bacterium]
MACIMGWRWARPNWKRAPKTMNNEAIAERFNRLANLMEIRGDDRYRIRSYRNAAELI